MEVLVNNTWLQVNLNNLVAGDIYRIPVGDGGWQQQVYTTSKILPVLPLTNIAITNAVLHGSIYWIAENTAMVITGNVALPDGAYMLMAERVIDATQVVDDARFIATVLAGKMTINITFKSTGNYKFSAARLNRGLDRISAGVHLSFNDIEFDVYV